MKDIHSHLLYGVDDGSKTLAESIELIKGLINKGVTDIILTPHYISNSSYNIDNQEKQKRFKEIKAEVKKLKLDIKLYLGNEISLDEKINTNLKKGNIKSINNTKYLLIELPFYGKHQNQEAILIDLITQGYRIILAHPERYRYLELEELESLKKHGIYLQGNLKSIIKVHGRFAKKRLKELLKKDMIDFLSLDCHRQTDLLFIDKSLKKLKKIIKEERLNELLNDNFDLIIKNKKKG